VVAVLRYLSLGCCESPYLKQAMVERALGVYRSPLLEFFVRMGIGLATTKAWDKIPWAPLQKPRAILASTATPSPQVAPHFLLRGSSRISALPTPRALALAAAAATRVASEWQRTTSARTSSVISRYSARFSGPR